METGELALTKLEPGAWARILRLQTGEPLASRLADLGFVPGGSVRFLFAAPSGDPRAYQIRGAVIALRNQDGAGIFVYAEPIDSGKNI